MGYKNLIELLIAFVGSFILVYLGYYSFIRRPFIRARKKQKEKKMPADLSIMVNYYKIDAEKIGYNYVLRILNIVDSLVISLIVVLIMGFSKGNSPLINMKTYIIQMVVAALLVIPFVLGSYKIVSKILKRKERKMNNV